jgi:hypothetical protein
LAEQIQPTRTIDQLRVRNRVRSTGKQVGEADLISHICRNYDQRGVEEPGHLLEEIAEQFLLEGLYVRSHIYCASSFSSIPWLRWVRIGQRYLSQ